MRFDEVGWSKCVVHGIDNLSRMLAIVARLVLAASVRPHVLQAMFDQDNRV